MFSSVLDKIPSLFVTVKSSDTNNMKKNRNTKMIAIPEFRVNLLPDYTISEKIDGSCRLLHQGMVWKRRDIKKNWKTGKFKTPPSSWVQFTDKQSSEKHKIGFMPIDLNNKEDKWDKSAIDTSNNSIMVHSVIEGIFESKFVKIDELPDMVTMEFIGPKVQGNLYNIKHHGYYIHGSAVINDLKLNLDNAEESLQQVKDYIVMKNKERFFEGIVVSQDNNYYKFHHNYI